MKARYFILSICILISSVCFGQKKLFDKYADEDGVTSVYISKSMFQLMGPMVETSGLKLKEMVGKIDGLNVLTTENKTQGDKMRKDFQGIVGKDHEELMRVKDGNTKAGFYIRNNNNKITEMIMLADTNDGFTIIQLLGNFTLEDIQEITSEINKK